MKIIYNEEEARKKKEEIDKRNREEKEKVKKRNWRTLWTSLIISVVIASASIPLFIKAATSLEEASGVACLLIGIMLVLFGIIPCLIGIAMQETFCPPQYPADVAYFIATAGRTVVKHLINGPDDSFVYVWLEDAEGCVERVMVCMLTRKRCTRVIEETADLTKGVLLVPYVTDDEPVIVTGELK